MNRCDSAIRCRQRSACLRTTLSRTRRDGRTRASTLSRTFDTARRLVPAAHFMLPCVQRGPQGVGGPGGSDNRRRQAENKWAPYDRFDAARRRSCARRGRVCREAAPLHTPARTHAHTHTHHRTRAHTRTHHHHHTHITALLPRTFRLLSTLWAGCALCGPNPSLACLPASGSPTNLATLPGGPWGQRGSDTRD